MKPDLASLNCFKYKDSQGKIQKIFIADKVAVKWKRLGVAMDFSNSDLNNIQSKHSGDVEKCSSEMLTLWVEGHTCSSSKKITWNTLLEALEDIRMKPLADELRTATLTKQT